jgi:multicomponent Na+:H+ antiporter subunit G
MNESLTLFQTIGLLLALIGSVLIFIAGIGLLRMPDLYLRMSASTKAATLGVGFVLAGAIFYLGDVITLGRALLIFLFILATIPISAHLIGRAAYATGTPLCRETVYDQLRGHYDLSHHISTSDIPDLPPTPHTPSDETA